MTFAQLTHNFLLNIESSNLYLLVVSSFIALTLTFLILALLNVKKPKIENVSQSSSAISSHDIKAIAGEDVMTTQLDLARAYIEMDNKQLAKKILEEVLEHGDQFHKQEAHALISTLELS